jgi:starvation-inducible DNA-binding protein
MTTRPQTTQTQTAMKNGPEAQPRFQQRSYEIQQYGQQHYMPLHVPEETVKQNVGLLNQILADSITLYQLYKKHHWQVAGPTFYQLHLLLEKHAGELLETVDLIGERIQTLGGVSIATPFDVAEATQLERPPKGEEDIPAMLARLVNAHSAIIKTVREAIDVTEKNKDYGTNDLLISNVLREHELQLWLVAQHLVDTPELLHDGSAGQSNP